MTPPNTTGKPVVAMFVRNKFTHDMRVTRQAHTLIEQGFHVVVFAAQTDPAKAGEEWVGPIQVIRFYLDSPVLRFVRLLTTLIGKWRSTLKRVKHGRVRITRRLQREQRRFARAISFKLAPILPQRYRRIIPKPVPPTTWETPRSVALANDVRTRIRNFLWPAHRFLQGIRYGRTAGRMAAAMQPVMYHCHDLNSILAGYLGRRIHPAPLIYDSHELWPHRNRPDKRRRKTFVLALGDRFFSRRADAVITVCDSIAQHMEINYGLKRPVVVIRNTPALAGRISLDSTILDDIPHPRIIYVGGIQTNRGLEELVDATVLIPEASLVAIGPGNDDYRRTLEKLIDDKGVSDRFRVPGSLPHAELLATITHGDVGTVFFQNYCLSYYYSLPNKFFECIHAGLPVVTSNFPELKRLVDQYEVGIYCDPEDPKEIARSINWMLANPSELARMRENTKKAAAELNWERESQRYLALYHSLIGSRWPSET